MPILPERSLRHRLLSKVERGEVLSPMEAKRLRQWILAPAVGLVWDDDAQNTKPEYPYDSHVPHPEGEISLFLGDNLPILQSWRQTQQTFDVMYLDPPYNTGRSNMGYEDTFQKKSDRFRHSDWCRLMAPRLAILHDLLTPDGVFFISIDERELAPLKLMLDDIFGDNNFIQCFTWEKTQHFGRQTKNAYRNTEFILAYAKQLHHKATTKRLLVEKEYSNLEDAPLFNRANPVNTLTFPIGSIDTHLPDGLYSISSKPAQYHLAHPVQFLNGINVTPVTLTFKSRWNQATLTAALDEGVRFLVKSATFAIRAQYPQAQRSYLSPRQAIITDPHHPQRTMSRYGEPVGTHEEGTRLLQEWGLNGTLLYPKPVSLIKYLISLVWDHHAHHHAKELRILDPFAGSGTTAHAVAELNHLFGEKHTVTLITKPEGAIIEDVLLPRLNALKTRLGVSSTIYTLE